VNERHYTNAEKQAARERLKHKASTLLVMDQIIYQ
jgi:hypothetical protein